MLPQPLLLADIPCLRFAPSLSTPKGLLLHYHGWGGSKDVAEPVAALFQEAAAAGWMILCPDCPLHGERLDPALTFRKAFNGWAYICEVMEQARLESRTLIAAALTRFPELPAEIRVSGSSMGGLIAQMVLLEWETCRRGLSLIGRSSFHQADPWCCKAQAGTWAEAWCEARAPQLHPERYRERDLLFLDGGKDTDCPAATNADTVARILAVGGSAAQMVDPDAGHQLSPPLLAAFKRWLLDPTVS